MPGEQQPRCRDAARAPNRLSDRHTYLLPGCLDYESGNRFESPSIESQYADGERRRTRAIWSRSQLTAFPPFSFISAFHCISTGLAKYKQTMIGRGPSSCQDKISPFTYRPYGIPSHASLTFLTPFFRLCKNSATQNSARPVPRDCRNSLTSMWLAACGVCSGEAGAMATAPYRAAVHAQTSQS